MLLIVTLAMALASAVLLIIGFVQDRLGFIYVSMLCAGVAGVSLFVFDRLTRRRSAIAAAGQVPVGEAAKVDAGQRVRLPAESEDERSDETHAGDAEAAPFAPPPLPPLAPTGADYPGPGRAGWRDGADDEAPVDWGEEVVFPIEDYDDLRASEILPLLSQLDADELRDVRDREAAGKARSTVLDRIGDRLARLEGTAKVAPVAPADQPSEAAATKAAPARARKSSTTNNATGSAATKKATSRTGAKKAPTSVAAAVPVAADVPDDLPVAADVPVTPDVEVAADAPVTADVPDDLPVAADVPVTADVPVAPDAEAPADVPVTPAVPVAADAPAPGARPAPTAKKAPARRATAKANPAPSKPAAPPRSGDV